MVTKAKATPEPKVAKKAYNLTAYSSAGATDLGEFEAASLDAALAEAEKRTPEGAGFDVVDARSGAVMARKGLSTSR